MKRSFVLGILGGALGVLAPPAGANPGSIPALNPSVPIPHLAPGDRVFTRIDANASSEIALVWNETSGQDGDLTGVYLSRNGAVEQLVNTTTVGRQQQADVSIREDGEIVVAWANTGNEVRWRKFEPAAAGGAEVTAFGGTAPGVDHYPDGSFLIVGIDPTNAVVAQRYDDVGDPDGGLLNVSTSVPGALVRVEITDDEYVGIVWANPPGTIIQMRIIKPDGTPLGPDFQVGLSANPVDGLDIDHGVGGFHVIWGFPGQVMTRVVMEDGTFPNPQEIVSAGSGPNGITAMLSGALGLYSSAGVDILGRCIDDIGLPNGAQATLDDVPVVGMGSLDFDGAELHVAYITGTGRVRLRSSLPLTPVAVGPGPGVSLHHRAVPTAFTRSTRIEYDGAGTGGMPVAVLDLSGRLVRELMPDCAGERCDAAWDGTDGAGRSVAPGVYFYRIVGVGGGRVVKL